MAGQTVEVDVGGGVGWRRGTVVVPPSAPGGTFQVLLRGDRDTTMCWAVDAQYGKRWRYSPLPGGGSVPSGTAACVGCGMVSVAAKATEGQNGEALCYTCQRELGKAIVAVTTGGGSVPAPEVRLHDFKLVPGAYAYECANCDCSVSDMASPATKMQLSVEVCDGRKTKPEPPPVRRCPERISDPGDAIENCDTVLGPDVQCFVCLGVRCFIHCGCLQHHKGAKIVGRGGQGSFEWAVWELEHAFRGQLYCKAADGSGLVILGTHGGASSDAVLSILLRNLEKIQGRRVRGEVIGQSAKARPTNEAAGELADAGDPERELRDLDAKVVLLLDHAKRQYDAATAQMQKQRLWVLRICQDWLKSTEQTWRDLADDGEQNPRLVFQCKEIHDAQVAGLFFQLGQLFNGGES